jgi:hypothetical protein
MIKKKLRQLYKGIKSPRNALQKAGIIAPQTSRVEVIPIKNILRSGECNISANQYARLIGKPLRASEIVMNGPHVKFLREYQRLGMRVLEKDFFESTAYYQNAVECISFTGHYFPYIKQRSQIIEAAKGFIDAFEGKLPEQHIPANGHSRGDDLIEVRPIKYSNCYELVNGNHRIASAMVRGQEAIRARVLLNPVTTPAQDMLMDVLWQNGRLELYQPVDLPEVSKWPLLRQCTDRYNLINNFLHDFSGLGKTYLDVGSSYGWFVSQFLNSGYDAYGLERDSFAIKIGCEIYGVPNSRFTRSDIIDFLSDSTNSFDIVSCFSVAHHFVLGKASTGVEDLLKKLDKITRKVLFFDTGEGHEEWFKKTLTNWNPDFIEHFLKTQTTFAKIIRLGKDQDNRGEFVSNYGRTLFACVR